MLPGSVMSTAFLPADSYTMIVNYAPVPLARAGGDPLRYARDANSSLSVVAPPLGGVLTSVSIQKRPPRKRRPLFCFPAASGA